METLTTAWKQPISWKSIRSLFHRERVSSTYATCSNGRVPAIIDHTNNDHIVWESGAILLYLAERFDPAGKYAGKTLDQRSEVWEWLFFQVNFLSGENCSSFVVKYLSDVWPWSDSRPGQLVQTLPPSQRSRFFSFEPLHKWDIQSLERVGQPS